MTKNGKRNGEKKGFFPLLEGGACEMQEKGGQKMTSFNFVYFLFHFPEPADKEKMTFSHPRHFCALGC